MFALVYENRSPADELDIKSERIIKASNVLLARSIDHVVR